MNAKWTGSGYSKAMTNEEQRALGLPTYKRFYLFKHEPDNRETLCYDGAMFRVPDNCIHDFGSGLEYTQGIPILRRWFSRDSYPRSVVLHDAAYSGTSNDELYDMAPNLAQVGTRHQLWISVDNGDTWAATPVSRELADELLRIGILAEGGPRWVAWTYHKAVRLFGRFVWDDGIVED